MNRSHVPTCVWLSLVIAVVFGVVERAHSQTSPGRPGITAFVDVGVVPMDTERVLQHQTVVVEGHRIVAFGPSRRIQVPAGAVRVDARGKFLLPGLADMHAHFTGYSPHVDIPEAERTLFAYLASGVTTLRSMSYSSRSMGEAVLLLRARAASGELLSPRIYAAGLWGDPKNGSGGNGRGDRTNTKPEDVAAQVAAYKAAGYDHLKTREDIDPTTEQGRALFDSLIAAATRMGMPVVGHVVGEPGWFARNPTALRSVEHLTAYRTELPNVDSDSATYAAFYAKLPGLIALTKQAGVWNCITWAHMGGGRAFTKLAETHERVRTMRAVYRRLIKGLQDAGAGLLLGTDYPVAGGEPGDVVLDELEALVGAGLTPYQALATGTKNVADFYGTLEESGTIAVGKRADLVLLTGNPLVDVRNVAKPAGVMLGGRWLPHAELLRHAADMKSS